MATVAVQSLLNAATFDTYTVTLTDTVDSLKLQIVTADSVDAAWFDLVLNEVVLTGTDTLAAAGVTDGARLRTHNKIARLGTKQAKQAAKLALAALDRAAYGARPQYLDISKLPNPYVGNAAGTDTGDVLESGRPWSLTPVTPPFENPTLSLGSAVTTSAISPFSGGGNSYIFSSSVDSYIQTPASTDWAMGTGDFTVEWFSRQTTLTQFQRVFTVGDYPAIDFGVSIESGTFYFWSGGDIDFDYSSASAVVTNTWYHFAVVRSGTTLSVYRNGTLLGSSVTNTDNINDTITPFVVGNTNTYATNAAFVGAITNFRLVKGLAVYTGNFTVPTSALTATADANPYGGINTQAIPDGFTKLLLIP